MELAVLVVEEHPARSDETGTRHLNDERRTIASGVGPETTVAYLRPFDVDGVVRGGQLLGFLQDGVEAFVLVVPDSESSLLVVGAMLDDGVVYSKV